MKTIIRFVTIFFLAVVLCGISSCTKRTDRSASITAFSGSFVEQGRPIANLAHYRIAYYEPAINKGTSGSDAHVIQESDDPFIVVDYGPQDSLPSEITRPSMYVIFSQPVIPLARLGEPIREGTGLFTIEPPLSGIYRWYGSRLLSFEPDADSLPQQRYTITVSDRITSLGGKKLEGERSFSFETERLSILEWQLGEGDRWVWSGNVHPEDAKYIQMIFSYPVNLDEIAQWLEVRAAGKIWPFTLERLPGIDERRYRKEQGVLLSINEKLPLNTGVEMALKAGARSEPGWLGAKEERTWTYHTLLPFRFDNASTHGYSRPRSEIGDAIPVRLSFNQDVEPNGAERFISIDGFPALKKENIEVYGSTVVIGGLPLEYQKKYTVRITAGLKDLHGRTLGKAEQIEVNTGEASSYVHIRNWGPRMLEASFPPQIAWEAQNPVALRKLAVAAKGPYEPLPTRNFTNAASVPVSSARRHYIEDLAPHLNAGGKGSVALRWEYRTRSTWQPERIDSGETWLTVQVTDIGITVRYAYNTVLVWATRLSDGTAAANIDVELLEGEKIMLSGKTDAQGLAVFEFLNGNFVSRFTEPYSHYWNSESFNKGLRIRVSDRNTHDQAEFIPNDSHNLWRFGIWTSTSPFMVERERPVTFLFTDRGLYRPGETVSFRGIDRILRLGQYTAYQGPYRIEVSSGAYQAPVIASLRGTTTANGGSFGSFELPANIEPGYYQISYRRARQNNTGNEREIEAVISFTVANFERLRFESSLQFPDITVYQGEKMTASLSASWLAGGGLSGAPYTWYVTREPAFVIPGGSEGVWRNWHFGPESGDERSFVGNGEGTLGPDGKAAISTNTLSDGIMGAVYRYRLEAAVQDAARQEIASRAAVLVHPASFYIAARIDPGRTRTEGPSAFFLNAGQVATLSWALVSPEGEQFSPGGGGAIGSELSMQLVRHEWKQARQAGVGGRVNLVWERVEEIVEQKNVRTNNATGAASGLFHFTPDKSGLWEIRLQSSDHKQRIAATRFRFYVSGAGWVNWGSDDIDAITLTPDRQSYAPGETAKILVRTPLEKGKYLFTIEREGIISQQIIELEGSALTIDIPIKETYLPVVYAALSSYTVRSGPPQNSYYEPDIDKPKGVFGVTPIYVDHASRQYQIEIESGKNTYRPAEEAEVKIKVLLNGKPAPNTEVSFMAVDRGVLDLINYRVPNPAAFFYDPQHFPLGVRGADSRSLLIDPVTYSLSDLYGGDSDGEKSEDSARADTRLDERKDFRATAVFEPYLVTGPDGIATVQFTLPDSLTTFRCTALAIGQHYFGITEQDVRVSAPLTAVAALPRKLRWRDTGTVSLILTNLEREPVEAHVSLATSADTTTENLWDTVIEVDGEHSKTVKILPGASAEVRFTVAALGVGEAQLTFTLRSPQVNERIIRTLLVDRPSLTETVTTIGNLGTGDSFIEEGMILPSLVPEGTGNVAVTLSASRLATLKETVRYLLDYPYGCIEQRTAHLLSLVAFGDHLDSFNLDSPLKGSGAWNPKKMVEEELEEIVRSQLGDGSFPYWPGGSRSDIFVSLRVAHIAALAKSKGMKIPNTLDTRRLISWITAAAADTKDPFIKGYSLWVRTMYAERIGSEISAFLRQGDELGISGWAFAGLAALELGQRDLAASTRDRVRRFIRPGTRSLDLTDTYERQGNFWGYDSDRYALALMLFHALSPGDDMVTRLANSLIERQRQGVWNNTASSFWAVLAFGMLGDSESAEWNSAGFESGITANVSLGGTPLLNTEFKNYGGAPVSYNGSFSNTPINTIPRDTLLPLRIERSPFINSAGPRLYYTASLRYGIPVELAGARDEGIGIFAETFDSDGTVVKDGRLRPGKTYTRRITISSFRDRTHVALRTPVPSGAEIVDAVFVTSSTTMEQESAWDYRDYHYYEPLPVRFIMDDEVRFHWDFFNAGKQQVEFRFRAVMPGIYPTPPSSAECMYEPEIFGRSSGELVRIE
ncbi:MAG: MG2 domain-containing protein [Treponema sp.]|nr:MG2 domain-containing protein [Treponema sp.]